MSAQMHISSPVINTMQCKYSSYTKSESCNYCVHVHDRISLSHNKQSLDKMHSKQGQCGNTWLVTYDLSVVVTGRATTRVWRHHFNVVCAWRHRRTQCLHTDMWRQHASSTRWRRHESGRRQCGLRCVRALCWIDAGLPLKRGRRLLLLRYWLCTCPTSQDNTVLTCAMTLQCSYWTKYM